MTTKPEFITLRSADLPKLAQLIVLNVREGMLRKVVPYLADDVARITAAIIAAGVPHECNDQDDMRRARAILDVETNENVLVYLRTTMLPDSIESNPRCGIAVPSGCKEYPTVPCGKPLLRADHAAAAPLPDSAGTEERVTDYGFPLRGDAATCPFGDPEHLVCIAHTTVGALAGAPELHQHPAWNYAGNNVRESCRQFLEACNLPGIVVAVERGAKTLAEAIESVVQVHFKWGVAEGRRAPIPARATPAAPPLDAPCGTCHSATRDECARNDCPESYAPIGPPLDAQALAEEIARRGGKHDRQRLGPPRR